MLPPIPGGVVFLLVAIGILVFILMLFGRGGGKKQ